MATGINVELKHKSNDMFPNITTLYFDMDGVLADFAKGAEKLGAWVKNGDATELDWSPIYDAGEDFWANLEWTPNGKELFTKVYDYVTSKGCQVCILSAVHYKEGIEGKKIWLKNNLPSGKKNIKAYFTKDGNDKAGYITNVGKFADEDCVLIDDFGKNCKFFRDHGGQAIKFSGSVEEVMKELKRMFEWDIHEKYLTKKAEKVLNEVDCDFASYKKKILGEDLIGKAASYLLGGAKKSFDKSIDAIKKSRENAKKEKDRANSFDLNAMKDGQGLELNVNNDNNVSGYIYLVKKNGSLYFATPIFLEKPNGKNNEQGIDVETLYQCFKKKAFFVKCSASVDNEDSFIKPSAKIEIQLDRNSMRNSMSSKIYTTSLKSYSVYNIDSYKVMSVDDIISVFYNLEWFKKYREQNDKNTNKDLKIKLDRTNEDSYEESYKKLGEMFEDEDNFTFVSADDKEYKIFKKNGHNLINIRNADRPVEYVKHGIIIDFE